MQDSVEEERRGEVIRKNHFALYAIYIYIRSVYISSNVNRAKYSLIIIIIIIKQVPFTIKKKIESCR